jgi:xanthine dehydrogenase molybdopterin-binding subunit B
MPGVVAFLSAKDIPGRNSFVPVGLILLFEDEEVCRFFGNVNAVPKTNRGTDVEMVQWNKINISEAV